MAIERLADVYATDADVALVAAGDYLTLCPRHQRAARGSDGAILASSPWVLTSPSVDFEASGVSAGSVVHLDAPRSEFPPPGDLLWVSSASGHAATLARLGLPAGAGAPPISGSADVARVAFSCATFRPQIETASYEINRIFGVDAGITGRQFRDLYEPRELNRLCVLMVLADCYLAMTRQAGADDDFGAKAQTYALQRRDQQERLEVRWRRVARDGTRIEERTNRFSTRITR